MGRKHFVSRPFILERAGFFYFRLYNPHRITIYKTYLLYCDFFRRFIDERFDKSKYCGYLPYGYAIFLSAPEKTFVVYVDKSKGAALQSAFEGISSERPLTHEFVMQMLDGLDCKIKRVVIYHVCDGTFFTNLTVEMSNELGEKIVEIDGRPSDTFALAMRANAPILIDSAVLETLPDMSEALKKLRGEV